MCLQDVNVEVWATLIKGIGTETLGPLGIHICYKIRHGFKGYHQDLGCKVIFSWWVLNKLLGKYYYFFIFFLVFSFPTGMFLSYLSTRAVEKYQTYFTNSQLQGNLPRLQYILPSPIISKSLNLTLKLILKLVTTLTLFDGIIWFCIWEHEWNAMNHRSQILLLEIVLPHLGMNNVFLIHFDTE